LEYSEGSNVYRINPCMEEELKENVQREAMAVPQQNFLE
jgi:hypothetical protein